MTFFDIAVSIALALENKDIDLKSKNRKEMKRVKNL